MFFDPEQFMQTPVTGALSTEYVNIPEGEYLGMIRPDGIKPRKITTQNGESVVVDLTWETDDPKAKEVTGRNSSQARQSIFLDLTAEGHLDLGKGKNVQLGRLREALKQNDNSRPWSFGMLSGVPAYFVVQHRQADGKVYADVKAVRPL